MTEQRLRKGKQRKNEIERGRGMTGAETEEGETEQE